MTGVPAVRRLVVITLLASACGRDYKPAPVSDVVVEGHAENTTAGLTLTLSARPQDLVMDDITYTRVETVSLVVRANGARVQPTGERSQGTLSGGDVIVTLPSVHGASRLTLEGSVVVRNVDGSELERAPVPAIVEIR